MIRIFDANVHFTVDGTFKNYTRNIPASLRQYEDYLKKDFELIGICQVGIENIGNYSHPKFINLRVPRGSKRFAAVERSIIQNPTKGIEKLKLLGFDGVKYHPKITGTSNFHSKLEPIMRECKEKGLVFGICTYESDFQYSSNFESQLRQIIETTCSIELRTVLFHGTCLNFKSFYMDYGKQKNLMFDTSFSLLRLSPNEFLFPVLEALKKGHENICFGTDFPDYNLTDYMATLTNIKKATTAYQFNGYCVTNILNFLDD